MKLGTTKIASSLLVLTVILALLAGYGTSSAATQASNVKSVITIAQLNDVISFDPHDQNETGSANVIRCIYDPLVRLDQQSNLIPSLAESWEFPDNRTIKFNLRQGVTFHNGYPFSAEDIKFSLDRQRVMPKQRTTVSNIDSCEIVDEYTVLVHLIEPGTQPMLAALSRPGAHIVSKRYTEEIEAAGKTLNEAPVGTGPYKFVSFQSGNRTVMEANHDYFEEVMNDGIIMRCIPEAISRTIALETGEIDMILEVGAVDANRIRNNPALALDEFNAARFEFMGFNTTRKPFDDIRVRQAFMHLVNRNNIIRVAENGEAVPLYSPLSHGAVGYTPDVRHYEYDVEKAKALLAEAGYPDGFSVTYHTASEHRLRIAQVLQASFAEAGIALVIEAMEPGPLYDFLDARMHQIGALSRQPGSPDPDITLSQMYHSQSTATAANIFGIADPRYDELIYNCKFPQKLYAGHHRTLTFSTSRISRCCLDNSG